MSAPLRPVGPATGPSPLASGVAVALILGAAALLRYLALDLPGLWCDEAYTAQLASEAPLAILRRLATTDDAPPLYYLLVKPVSALLGRGEGGVRALSATAGWVAVLLLALRGLRRRDRQCLWAAGVLAVATYGVFHARQARSYALLMLFALAYILLARDLLLDARRRAGAGLPLLATALFLTHHLGILIVGTGLVLWPLRSPRGASLRRWLGYHLPPLLLWAGYWLLLHKQLALHGESNAWMLGFWQSRTLPLAPLYSLAAFVPGLLAAGQHQIAFPHLPPGWSAWRWLAAGAAAAVALLALRPRPRPRNAARPDWRGRAAAIETGFLLLPLVALTVASLTWRPTYVLARTDAIAFPAFSLLVGRALARGRLAAGLTLLALWALVTVASLAPNYGLGGPPTKGRDRQLARELIADGLGANDAIVHTHLTAPSLEYYFSRWAIPHARFWFPPQAARNPAAVYPTPLDSLARYAAAAQRLRSQLEATLDPDGVLYLLALEPGPTPIRRAAEPRAAVTANEIAYPSNLLLYALCGLRPCEVWQRYRQDWIAGRRLVLRLPRSSWTPRDSIPPLGEAP